MAGDTVSAQRRRYIEKGQIAPAEYAADLMAAYYSGSDAMTVALRQATRERYSLIEAGDNNARLAWWELRMRREAVQKLRNDEDIEKEFCRILNVSDIEKV